MSRVQKGEYATRIGRKAHVTTIYMDERFPYGGTVDDEWGHRWSLIGAHEKHPDLDLCFPWTPQHEEVRTSWWAWTKAHARRFLR